MRPRTARPGALYLFYRSLPRADFPVEACLLIDPPASGYWGEMRGAIDRPLVSEFQRDSALLRHTGIDKVNLQAAREFAPAPGSEVFAESFGKPLIFGQWRGARRWLVLPFDLESSDFVLRTAFPILLGNVVDSLRHEGAAPSTEALPGPVESALVRTAALDASAPAGTAPRIDISWWNGFPLWWWAVVFGVCWLLAEWWSFSRRITE